LPLAPIRGRLIPSLLQRVTRLSGLTGPMQAVRLPWQRSPPQPVEPWQAPRWKGRRRAAPTASGVAFALRLPRSAPSVTDSQAVGQPAPGSCPPGSKEGAGSGISPVIGRAHPQAILGDLAMPPPPEA